MKHMQFICSHAGILQSAMDYLTESGVLHLYTVDDQSLSKVIIGGFAEKECPLPPYLTLHSIEEAAIDWNAQWQEFSPYATLEGDVSCSLKAFNGPDTILRLFPGAGFGDLSHPTTQLMLKMMCPHSFSFVIDIGCGSGVLSCAAALLGAEKVYGYDIDPSAIHHAAKNVVLNGVQGKVKIGIKPIPHIERATILLNMTLKEQKKALASLTIKECTWIVSGIHEENLSDFETFRKTHNLSLSKEYSLDKWYGFLLHSS